MQPERFQRFRSFLEDRTGILLGEDKRYLVETRLARLVREQGFESLDDLIEQLLARPTSLQAAVVDAMTTNETLWFRDEYPFRALTEKFFPEAVATGKRQLKIWSAACSSGQEPYSISITADEYQAAHKKNLMVDILGTDLSSRMITQAEAGIYDDLSLGRGLSMARRDRYFRRTEKGWQVQQEIRSRVRFQRYNLLDSAARLGRFDLVFCRNVLIYFSRETKAKIVNQLADALQPGGYLLLGASESINQISDRFAIERLPSGGIVHRLVR